MKVVSYTPVGPMQTAIQFHLGNIRSRDVLDQSHASEHI